MMEEERMKLKAQRWRELREGATKRDANAYKHRHMTEELTALRTQISLFA